MRESYDDYYGAFIINYDGRNIGAVVHNSEPNSLAPTFITT